MKSLLRSMTSRVFLVTLSGILLTTLLTTWLALSEQQRMIGQFRDYHAVERVAQFILSVETVPRDLRPSYLAAASGIGMRAALSQGDVAVSETQSRLAAMLDDRLPDRHRVLSLPAGATDCPLTSPRRAARYERREERVPPCESLLVTLSDGERIRLSILPPRPPKLAPRIDYLTYGSLFLVCLALVAAGVARMTMRPLKQLAQAATALGTDIERPPLPERGATEIRQAARAFNAMQSRIHSHIRQRSHMLAAITHDLQTPMTRLRLRLEKVDNTELREKLVADLSAMQGMVREGLDLARSMDSAEPMQLLDLDSLIDSVCTDAADAGERVSLSGTTGASLRARPLALRRCLTNLIENAVKYGQHADVTVEREIGLARIRIADDGPGLAEAELDKVFEPFYRVEASRSRHTGGSGLGLTIARNIAEQHGGRILLANRPQGGLLATLELPLAPKADDGRNKG